MTYCHITTKNYDIKFSHIVAALLSLLSADFPMKQMPPSNSSGPIGTALNEQQKKKQTVATASDRRNTLVIIHEVAQYLS